MSNIFNNHLSAVTDQILHIPIFIESWLISNRNIWGKESYFLIDPVDPLTYKYRQQFSENLFRNLKDILEQNINELNQNKIMFVRIIPTDKWNEIESESNNLNLKEIKRNNLTNDPVGDTDLVECNFNNILREAHS